MLKLEDIQDDQFITGIEPAGPVQIIRVKPAGANSINITYELPNGTLLQRQLYRTDESRLSVVSKGLAWAFSSSAHEFKLGAEALRIHLAHLFDPMMAVHTSDVEPLPHQISAVYEEMLSRQPLRFVLADDPGAGKTIMAGLLIRELMSRSDLERCLIVAPGSLVEQWQTELSQKFGLRFDILTHQLIESTATGNPFVEKNLLIARLDQLARSGDWQEKLQADDARWDLVIFDEAHKLSATFFGNKIKATKRRDLGMLLGDPARTRHLLLMTATPHNGKEEDFQLFMALVDRDRFHGKPSKDGAQFDASDLMRRMVKEDLVRFDGTKLFPERVAKTLPYKLSDAEMDLYRAVTSYVTHEMNRADKLDKKRKGTVGFALTVLQRRLASSPMAIYQSLERRCQRLKKRLEELQTASAGTASGAAFAPELMERANSWDDSWDDWEEELSDQEREELESQLSDQATTAQTIPELQAEIASLERLTAQANQVLRSGEDRKWDELSKILQHDEELLTRDGKRRKLIVFTEHRDTLQYLEDRIRGVIGDRDAVVTIHGGTKREERLHIQEQFRQNPDVVVLVATDAAGEGVNLQTANLLVNYDLPWNPNRIEQRFGRIHRIGQTEVCNMWNLVAIETREGHVFQRLFAKLDAARDSLKGRVFDVLGQDVFEEQSLRDMLIEAIRYGESPEAQAKLFERVDRALDTEHLHSIIHRNALSTQVMSPEHLYSIKEQMERAEARKLQPYFLRKFLFEAFAELQGEFREREPLRYEVRHVPALVRKRHALKGTRIPVLPKYERITFDRDRIHVLGKPMADLMHPGHPLMASVIDLTLDRLENALKQGTVLVDPNDMSDTPRMLFIIEHSIREGSQAARIASQRMHMVEIDASGQPLNPGIVPYLDYEAPQPEDQPLIDQVLAQPWLQTDLSAMALSFATERLVPEHLGEVQRRRHELVHKTLQAVHERLVKEINYWSRRARELQVQVDAGKQPTMQPVNARRQAEELQARLQVRERELEDQLHLSSNPPAVRGGALILPRGLVDRFHGRPNPELGVDAEARKRIEAAAMNAVMDAERALGNTVKDVAADKCGWDVTAITPAGVTRHIEVKGRHMDATTITVTHNEVLYGLNQGDKFILAIVRVDGDRVDGPHYIRKPFTQQPDPHAVSINLDLRKLLEVAVAPAHT